jgi:hypothetical protein
VVVVLAALATVAFGRSDGEDTDVIAGPAGAAQMLTGTVEGAQRTGSELLEYRRRFAVAIDGSSSFESTDGTGAQTFDARTRRSTVSAPGGAGGGVGWFPRQNAAPQPPAFSNLLSSLVVGVGGGAGERTTFLGRRAERLVETGALRAFGNRGDADRIEAVVDLETGILLRYEATLAGEVVARLEVVELEASPIIVRSRFEVDIPAGDTTFQPSDDGFRLVELDDLEGVVRYRIDAPAEHGGFRLDTVAARPGMPGSQSGAANPLDRDRVQLLYRKGWRAVEVVVRRRADTASPPTGPPAIPESNRDTADFTVTVRGDLDAAGREDLLDRITPRD